MYKNQVTLSGIKISYLENHPTHNDQPTIIFLHGWGLSAKVFTPSLQKIAQTYRVIAPDLPGFGASTGDISKWSNSDYANTLFEFIEYLGITNPVIMGQSLGGSIALTMAAMKPDFFSGMILISSTGVPLGSPASLLSRKALELLLQFAESKSPKQHIPMIKTSLYNYAFRTLNSLRIGNLARSMDLVPILGDISTPTLILWGKQDMTTSLSSGEILDRSLPVSKLIVVDNAFHEWSILKPDILAELVVEHLPKLLKHNKTIPRKKSRKSE